jgi:peptidoglycan/xylan/chitin deacetylase (PgdA/CDA1 family)
VLALYKSPENHDPKRFLAELAGESQGDDPPATLRLFLNWQEAGEMIRGGMAIGSHTHSHHVLTQLGTDHQGEELTQSRRTLRE